MVAFLLPPCVILHLVEALLPAAAFDKEEGKRGSQQGFQIAGKGVLNPAVKATEIWFERIS